MQFRATPRFHIRDIQALFGMTPYCWKTPKAGVEKLCKLTQLDCRIAFDIHVFEKEG